jgi:hypothetical protein
MKSSKRLAVALGATTISSLLLAPAALAAPDPAPAWSLQSLASPTNFYPGDESGLDSYQVHVVNNGGETTDGSAITITDTLPKGLVVKNVEVLPPRVVNTPLPAAACKIQPGEVATVRCEIVNSLQPNAEPAKLNPDDELLLEVSVATPVGVTGPLVNRVEVEGGGAPANSLEAENLAAGEDAKAGFEEFHAKVSGPDGRAASAAASHPFQYTTTFAVNLAPSPPGSQFPLEPAGGDLREIEVTLPPGLVGNPTATTRCPAQQFNTAGFVSFPLEGNALVNECPESSVVGLATVQQREALGAKLRVPIYNLTPPKGMPAQLGFQVLGAPIYINTRLRSEGDFGISAFLENVTEAQRVTAARVSIWGTPGDKLHNTMRGRCGISDEGLCPVAGTARPFLRLPTQCENPLLSSMSIETWARPGAFASAESSEGAPGGCGAVPFTPSIESRPTTNVADSPSGLHFDLHLPQGEHEDPAGLGEADLRSAVVMLPEGLVVNPASANGRGACTPTQVGFTGFEGARASFDANPAQCPEAAKVGRVEAISPAVDHPLQGSVYLARQFDNPFNSLLAIYIVLEDAQSGIVVKLAGKLTLDPATGQLTTTVSDSPQLPVEDFSFDFFEGPRAPLRTPMSCGEYSTITQMTPWSAPAGAVATPADSFQIAAGPAGPCPTGALAPKLSAGLANPTAATYSPFSLRLTRADGTGEITAISTTTPTGLSAKLAGIPYCPEAGIAQAAARSGPGQGAAEAAASSCPAASQVGTTTAGAGAGPAPFYTSGKVYLAGPYKGASISLLTIVPALAGPFDLGVVVDRIALQVDPETAQVTAAADPLPRLLAGIPLDLREIRVDLDRKDFTLAPTSCEPKSVNANVTGPAGAATATDRFQVGGCAALGFKPKLSLKLLGGTKRNDHPTLKSTITYPKGSYANIAKAVVTLPPSEQIDNAHIQNPCTRVQFNAHQCPPGSILGYAKAFSPLLDKPLEGPVYFRSNGGERLLPDIVADLNGQLHVVAVGFVKSVHARIRTTFAAVPDAPLSKFTLNLKGGKKGLLVNNRDICAQRYRVGIKLTAHNAKHSDSDPLVGTSCKVKKR